MEELLALLDDPAVKIAIERAILLGALVTARVAPIVQLVPYLGGKATPQTVKLGLSMAITALVFPLVFRLDLVIDFNHVEGLPRGAGGMFRPQ